MRATQLIGVGDLQTRDVPDPTPAAGEVVIEVEAAGICGTDRHLYKGEFPSVPGKILGHEFSGIIVDAGDTAMTVGTRVTCDPNIWCGTCENCRRGRVNLCPNNVAIGIARDGGFAQYCALPARQAHTLPCDLDPAFGAFCEPLACTLHGMDIGAARAGEKVLIIGGGVIGQLAVQLAARTGAEVMLLTRNSGKQVIGCANGAALSVGNADAARAHWPEGANLVVECAGVPETISMAPGLTASGGRIVILGVLPSGERISIEPFDLLFREIDMRFSFLNPFTHARATGMIASGQIDVSALISRQIKIDEVSDVIVNPPLPEDVRVIARF